MFGRIIIFVRVKFVFTVVFLSLAPENPIHIKRLTYNALPSFTIICSRRRIFASFPDGPSHFLIQTPLNALFLSLYRLAPRNTRCGSKMSISKQTAPTVLNKNRDRQPATHIIRVNHCFFYSFKYLQAIPPAAFNGSSTLLHILGFRPIDKCIVADK